MKLTLERKSLLAALNLVKPAGCGRTTLPILSHVALNCFEKSVELICTNLELTLRAKCDADVRKKGSTTVRVDKLHALVNSFTGDDVDLELEKDVLLILRGGSKYKLGVLPIDDFPPTTKFKDADEITLPAANLRTMLAITSFCSSTDEARYVIQGNLLKLDADITTVATDGRRLAISQHPVDEPVGRARELILPGPAVKELLRLMNDSAPESRVRVLFADQAAEFKLGDTVLTTKLIEGNFPNYKQVIPSTRGIKPITLNRAEFLTLLQRVCIIQNEFVRLDFNKHSLTLRALNTREVVGDAYENMDTSPGDRTLKIKFNPTYLIEALKAVTDDQVLFYGTDEVSPGVFQVNNASPNAGWQYVIMPMRGDEGSSDAPATDEAKVKGVNPEPVAA